MSFASRVNLDAGGGYSPPSKIAAPITAAPTAQLSYAKPQVTTSPSPIAYPQYQPTPAYNGGGSGIYQPGNTYGGGGGGGMSAPAAPPPPPKPDFGSADYTNGGHDSELDGTFHNQVDMYSSKLKKYIADYDAQTGGKAWGQDAQNFDLHNLGGSMGGDYTNAQQGIARNKDLGLRSLSEDFANRGMVNSGLYGRDFDQSRDQYDRQGQNLDHGVRSQLQNLNFNRGNTETDNQAQIASARSDALSRLARSQSL